MGQPTGEMESTANASIKSPIIKTGSSEEIKSAKLEPESTIFGADVTEVPLGENNSLEPNRTVKKSEKVAAKVPEQSNKLVSVINPERVGDREPFVVYTVQTKKSPLEGDGIWQVKRRFQDFSNFYDALREQFEEPIIVPPLPSKSNFELKDKFHPVFVERRRDALERFLTRILLHPVLADCQTTKDFLTQQTLLLKQANASSSSMLLVASSSGIASLMEQVGDAVSGLVFGKSGTIEERFESMKTLCRRLAEHFAKLEEITLKIYKAHRNLEESLQYATKDYAILASCVKDESLQKQLARLSLASEDQSQLYHDFAVSLKTEFITSVHEWHKYSCAAKDSLKARDEKQGNCADLNAYLSKSRQQHNELRGMSTGQDEADPSLLGPIKQGAKAVSSYVNSHIDKMKGLDMITAKQQKIVTLEKRIGDLEAALKAAEGQSATADEVVEREMAHFEDVLRNELQDDLLPTIQRLYHQLMTKSVSHWEHL